MDSGPPSFVTMISVEMKDQEYNTTKIVPEKESMCITRSASSGIGGV